MPVTSRVTTPAAAVTAAVRRVRVTLGGGLVAIALLGIAVVAVSGEWSPAVTPEVAKMRLWIAARASGVVTMLMLTALTLLGIVLSHPTNRSSWKASRHIFPWHKHLALFTLCFGAVHILALIADPYAGVGIAGSFIPGLSGFRTWPVAVGTLAMYAIVLTSVTARFTWLLPRGRWLTIHHVSGLAFAATWVHGVTSGTDTAVLLPLYAITGAAVMLAAATRYWSPMARAARPEPAASSTPVHGRLATMLRGSRWR
jgi:sulfoxide reductase heme-binding subunit YedZ